MVVILTTIIGLEAKIKERIKAARQSVSLDTVVTFRIAKIVFVIGPICQDSSLERGQFRYKEAGCKEKISFRIQKKTHRNGHHNKSNENRIVTVNQKQSLLIRFFINSMVELTKIKQEQRKHNNEIKNRINREFSIVKKLTSPIIISPNVIMTRRRCARLNGENYLEMLIFTNQDNWHNKCQQNTSIKIQTPM